MGTNNTEKFKVAFLCIPDLMAIKVVIDMGSLISKEIMGQKVKWKHLATNQKAEITETW